MSQAKKRKIKPEQQPRRHPTPPADVITPPSVHRHALLPLVDVGSRKFEEICRDLLRQRNPELRPTMKRSSGHEQFGVDVEGLDDLQNPTVVVSAKCYKNIAAWEFTAWINDFIKHLDGHWKGKGVKEFIIAVSVEANNDDLNDAARKLAAEMREQDIKFVLWDSLTISDLLRKDPQLVDRYFNESWVKALSADVGAETAVAAATPFTVRGPTTTQGAIFAQIESMYAGHLSEALSKRLEEAVAGLRRGKRSAVEAWLNDAQSDMVVWASTNPETKARGLRAVAMVLLGRSDIKTAERLLDEADEIARAPDRTARAFLIRARDGGQVARIYLASPDGRRERELMSALLIEDGAPKEAMDVLASLIGDEVTSEVLRLRALATFMAEGKRSEALNLVTSATSKEPDSAMALFTRGVLRMACSLAHGVTPQFGNVPNPISRSLVLATSHARGLLEQAVADFDRLLETLEDDFRREVEVWKLAALLLNQDTRDRARNFARALFARNDFDPSAVAWALMHGLPLKQGRIKKTLGDAVREGKGTPSHVVILALLAAGRDSRAKGLAVIEKFSPLYPDAEEFFAHWRSEFSSPDDDINSFSGALRHGLATGDIAPIDAYLATHLTEVENLMAGAEFLASCDAFDLVDRLRPRLQHIHTSRAVELAAVAALNSGDPRASITVLNSARENGIDNTRRLSYIRIKAWKALGSHHELIEDIQSQLEEQDDSNLRHELLDAYLRIGALDRVKEQAEIVLNTGRIDNRKAVQVALALRSYAPETARRALEEVGQYDVPDELAGIVLDLSSRLGLTSLQDQMIRKLVSDPDRRENFRSFDNVEDVLAMLEEQAKEYRTLLAKWLYGGIPAAAAMRADSKDFVLLFLAGRQARKNRVGDPLPMMLRAGGDRPALLNPVGQTRLHLDLSALLIAHRCGILELLEGCFEIHVPESLPEALVLISAEFHEVSKQVADAVRALDRRESAVEICKIKPTDVPELTFSQGGLDDDEKANLVVVLDRAYQTGHIVKAQLENIAMQLEISLEEPRGKLEKLLLGQSAFINLVRLEILEPLARAFPLFIHWEDVGRMLRQVESAEDEEQIRSQLLGLTQIVSEKLSSSRWKTLTPRRTDEEEARSQMLPPHVRCLVQVLPREGNDQGIGYIWIEDRAISKQPLQRLVSLPEVLAHLHTNSRLSDEQHRKIRVDLRRWGYLFLPIDINEIASVIEAAPVVGGTLIENSDLADLRRWFANDVLHLKYIDQSYQTDSDGRIGGEIRHTLDLSSLCSKLIGRIWGTSTATELELAARSSWIWSNLRITFMPVPHGSSKDGGRRTMDVLNAAQLLFIPIHAQLDHEKLTKASRRALVAWSMSSAIGPLAESDPVLSQMVADTVATMLSQLLDAPEGIEATVAKMLRKQMLALVREFLEFLPDDWEEKITSRKDLKQQLAIAMVLLLTIEGQLQVSVNALEEGISKCLSDGTSKATVPLHNNRKTARLELAENTEGLPTGTLIVGRRRYPLDPSTMALVHPVEQTRAKLLATLNEGGTVGRPLTPSYLTELAQEVRAEARVESFHERLKSDFARTKQLMWERISTRETIELADFDLPHFTYLLNFLGLPDDFRGSGNELIAASASALRDALGVERTVYRLSSIPFHMPDILLQEFRQALASGTGKEWAPRGEATTASLVWLLSSTTTDRPIADDEPGLKIGLSRDRAKLLVTILRHSARQAIKEPEWRKLPAELAFCLVWLHADQLARIVGGSGIDAEEFSRWLSARTRPKVFDFQYEKVWADWMLNSSIRLSSNLLLARVAATLLRAGRANPSWLKDIVGQSGAERWTPHPDVLVATAPGAPQGYWISEDPIVPMLEEGWLDSDHPLGLRDQNALMISILEETKGGDLGFLASIVLIMVDLERVDDAQIIALRERLHATLQDSAVKSEPDFLAVTEAMAKVCARLNDLEYYENWICQLANECSDEWVRMRVSVLEENEASRAANALFNSVYIFARSGDRTLSQCCSLIARNMKNIADAWPAALTAVASCLEGISQDIDTPTAADDILPTLLELRSR